MKASSLARIPVLGAALSVGYRIRIAWPYFAPRLRHLGRWLIATREEATNFLYDLDSLSEAYLCEFVAAIVRVAPEVVRRYMTELQGDHELRAHVGGLPYARRLGWYTIARITKPQLIVETGVDKGLGACVLAAALLRNATEGHPGRYVGTEIDASKGVLFREPYSASGRIVFGDSIETLRTIADPIDLFINDSDHSADYEAREYDAIRDKLSPNAIVLGDNAHVTDRLLRFARETRRRFLFFSERPADHWYPGAGIGAAFRDRA